MDIKPHDDRIELIEKNTLNKDKTINREDLSDEETEPLSDGEPPLNPISTAARPKDEEPRRAFVVNDRRFWTLSEEELQQESERPSLPTYVEQLKHEAEEKDRQLRDYIAAYKKEVGEGLEKTRQRLEREAEQRMSRARDQVLMPMLEVLDSLERSITAGEATQNCAALLDGVRLVRKQMVQKLQDLGLNRIPTVGHPFNPALHEALAMTQVSDPAHENLITTEFKPGFTSGDRVIRPAQVQVGRYQR